MEKFVLISPDWTEIKKCEGVNLQDAMAGFWSEVWEQGWGADDRVLSLYGDWRVYQQPHNPQGSLCFCGIMREIKPVSH